MNEKEHFIDHHGVRLHAAETGTADNGLTPLVIIPGLYESAEDYLLIMERFAPRRCVVITLRGRGGSDTPSRSYRLEDHVGDMEAAIRYLGLKDYVLFGYSRSVSYQIAYALDHLREIKGLIIGDYPAVHTKLREGWADFVSGMPPWRGKTPLERMSREALKGLEQDSEHVDFQDHLSTIRCPVLIMQAEKETPLTEEAVEPYRKHMANCRIVLFEGFNHNLYQPDAGRFIQEVRSFMNEMDRQSFS